MIDRERAEAEKAVMDKISDEKIKSEIVKLFSQSWQDGYDFRVKEEELNKGASF